MASSTSTPADSTEQWKPVPSLEGRYLASTFGRIMHAERRKIRQPREGRGGYLRVNVRLPGKTVTRTVHGLVADAFLGERPSGTERTEVNHLNGIKSDNRPSNLEYCSQSENSQHAMRLGLKPIPHGEQSSFARLTREEVKRIREIGYTKSASEVGRMFGVTKLCIFKIRNRKTWRHI